jgi:hypothetical protein
VFHAPWVVSQLLLVLLPDFVAKLWMFPLCRTSRFLSFKILCVGKIVLIIFWDPYTIVFVTIDVEDMMIIAVIAPPTLRNYKKVILMFLT